MPEHFPGCINGTGDLLPEHPSTLPHSSRMVYPLQTISLQSLSKGGNVVFSGRPQADLDGLMEMAVRVNQQGLPEDLSESRMLQAFGLIRDTDPVEDCCGTEKTPKRGCIVPMNTNTILGERQLIVSIFKDFCGTRRMVDTKVHSTR